MVMNKDIKERFDSIDSSLQSLNEMKAQCRGEDQKKDHDKLIAAEGNIQRNIDDIKALKTVDKEVADKLETLSGNLNQGMTYIKDLQRNGRIKVGFQTSIIAGIIATVIAGIIIYFATTIYESVVKKSNELPEQKILIEMTKQLKENTEAMQKLKEEVKKPTIIKIEEVKKQP